MTDPILQSKSDDVTASIEQRFSEGNDAAFDEVIECYLPAVQRLAYRLAGWEADVEDIVQDVFTAAFANRRKFRSGSSLKTWLFTITINTCRTRYRRRQLWRKFLNQTSSRSERVADDPADGSLVREQIEKVRHASKRLPAKYRDVIVLKYLEELPTQQVLEILKISKKAFYTRLNRARNYLLKELSDYLDDEQ